MRALQDHGFTLSAIERYLANVATTATPAELSVQRAVLTAWRPSRREDVRAEELAERAGRALSEDDVAWLVDVGALRRVGRDFQALPVLRLAVELLDVGMPVEGIRAADRAVRRHMGELADELQRILADVLAGYDLAAMTEAEAAGARAGARRAADADARLDRGELPARGEPAGDPVADHVAALGRLERLTVRRRVPLDRRVPCRARSPRSSSSCS